MRVLVDDKPHDPLTPAQERDIGLSRAQELAEGSMLSAEEATRSYISQTKWLFVIMGGLCLLLTGGLGLLADPIDQAMIYGAVVVANLSLAAFLFFLLRRRARVWNDRMGLRLLGLAPAGSRIGFDATGLSVGDRALPWEALQIRQVDLAEFTARRATMYRIDRLSLDSPSGTVVLDPAMMRNGRLMVDNIWRRLRPPS